MFKGYCEHLEMLKNGRLQISCTCTIYINLLSMIETLETKSANKMFFLLLRNSIGWISFKRSLSTVFLAT